MYNKIVFSIITLYIILIILYTYAFEASISGDADPTSFKYRSTLYFMNISLALLAIFSAYLGIILSDRTLRGKYSARVSPEISDISDIKLNIK